MQVRFFATIREITGASEVRWDEPVVTLGELLQGLSARYGPAFRRWVLDKDDLGKNILVVINGHDARHQGGIRTQIHPADTIAIFPAIAGGLGREQQVVEKGRTHPLGGYPALLVRFGTRCNVLPVRLDPADWVPRLHRTALHLDCFEQPE